MSRIVSVMNWRHLKVFGNSRIISVISKVSYGGDTFEGDWSLVVDIHSRQLSILHQMANICCNV
jgi:hypothetical protein